MLLVALPLAAQSDIDFDPTITEEQFATFSRLAAQSIYATPVEPARARGIFSFDVGVALTAVPVDTSAEYWRRSVPDDFTISDYVVVPRLIASKGLSVATISAMYSKVPDTDIEMWGAAVDVPIIKGSIVRPTLAVRGAYSILQGVDEFDLTTYGVEVFLSKGFGPLTPYAAVGRMQSDAEGRIAPETSSNPAVIFTDDSGINRYTIGVRLTLLFPKITVEATQAEERSYAAKVSFGL
ncbi:MAG TPA: hypothetical protein VNA69_03960 [Thermoanaerobaculia bacterium]|nr:hypothetical protein [Thermoanaerobaculia bacterium]